MLYCSVQSALSVLSALSAQGRARFVIRDLINPSHAGTDLHVRAVNVDGLLQLGELGGGVGGGAACRRGAPAGFVLAPRLAAGLSRLSQRGPAQASVMSG